MSADRASIDESLVRMGAFATQLPELDARMNAIKGKLATVDEGTEKAANLVIDRRSARAQHDRASSQDTSSLSSASKAG